ncbi:MAG: hypothetical protein NC222_07050 [Staphylococcus sp.]|nr:hypothetical protein [Staphylococcus sp.]
MKWKIKSFDLSDLNPIKFINKTLDFTEGEWFEKGEKVILNTPIQDADFRKNMTTGEIDPEAVKLFKELNGQEVEIVRIDKTESGENVGLASNTKPTYVTIKFEDGQEWKEVPTLWLKKKEEKKVKSKVRYEPLDEKSFTINKNDDTLPLVSDYRKFLDLLVSKTHIDRDEARDKYGMFTYRQWNDLFDSLGIKVQSKIVKEDGKYQAQSEKGRSFGTYNTKGEAEERLKQMEMFKHMKKSSLGWNANPENLEEETVLDLANMLTNASDRALELNKFTEGYSTEEERSEMVRIQKEAIKPILEKYKKVFDENDYLYPMLYNHLEDINYHTLNSAIKELMGNKIKSSLEENRYAVERISDLLDSGFEQEEIIDVVCNEYDCEPFEVEEFLRQVTAFDNNIKAMKLEKEIQCAIKEANKGVNMWTKLVKSNYEAGDHIEMTLEFISKDKDGISLFELDDVQFYKEKEEELQDAIETCIDMEFMSEWEDKGIGGFTVDNIDYEEGEKYGSVSVLLED